MQFSRVTTSPEEAPLQEGGELVVDLPHRRKKVPQRRAEMVMTSRKTAATDGEGDDVTAATDSDDVGHF